jgi:2-polyprenyl-3-methyl-5-hydroxy-6-metoxy-1,4-benzoquinol methylase
MADVQIEDKAGEKYWSKVWQNTELPKAINPFSKSPNNYGVRRFHDAFKKVFTQYSSHGKKILEVGCGNSVWLPYFAKEYGLVVSGLDYSEIGCSQSQAILKRENVQGEIFWGDLFNPPDNLIEQFDFVLSMGVVEHFNDTDKTIKALSAFLKIGGVLITTIPNHSSFLGLLQKRLNKPVYDIHIPLDKEQLIAANEQSNLKVTYSSYLISISFHANLEGKDKPVSFLWLKKKLVYCLSLFAKIVWVFETYIFKLPETKTFSAAAIVVAEKNKK